MSRVFVDSNVFIYASGSPHPLQEPARTSMHAIGSGAVEGVTSVEVLQELLHRCLTRSDRAKALGAFDMLHRLFGAGRVLPVNDATIGRARELAGPWPTLRARDLVHLATMEQHGIDEIMSTDRHFDGIPGITRIDPRQVASP